MAFRDQPLGELALSIPRASALFRKYDMDYCCGGKQTLARAASRKELDVEAIEAELAQLAEQPVDKDWRTAPLAEIIDHIIVRYHDRHSEIPDHAARRTFQPHDERGADPLPDDQTGHGQPGNGANQRDGKRT